MRKVILLILDDGIELAKVSLSLSLYVDLEIVISITGQTKQVTSIFITKYINNKTVLLPLIYEVLDIFTPLFINNQSILVFISQIFYNFLLSSDHCLMNRSKCTSCEPRFCINSHGWVFIWHSWKIFLELKEKIKKNICIK